jgi:tetratricopeptide (TPR) repeat protein
VPQVKASQSALKKAETLEQQAIKLKMREPEKAVRLLEQARAIDPTRVRTCFELASLYSASGRKEKAIQEYERLAGRNPPVAEALFNLAYLRAVSGEYARAESLYRRLADLTPAYLDEVLFNLAMVQIKQGKRAQCMENLAKAVAFNPSNNPAKTYLARLQGGSS